MIYEKWLPYQDTKERPVIVERAPAPDVYVSINQRNSIFIFLNKYFRIRPPKNVIIQYEQPTAHHEQIITDEGVFHADPLTHHATSTIG